MNSDAVLPDPRLTVGTIPDHELLRPIASGAYGEVWLAQNVVGTLRAVKIVRRDAHASAESFEREFKGLQKFEPISRAHDGLVDILTLGLLPDGVGFYYVMELADDANVGRASSLSGEKGNSNAETGTTPVLRYSPRTLCHDLKQHGHLAVDDCIQLGLKLTAALAHLHAQGLVHRDVKPSNILFIGGEPKLADAGLVAAVDDARSLVGTAGYIAPEGPGTPQADLYALGKVLYEAAFGKDRQEFPALPADVASRPDHARLLELNAILLRACATDRRERYQSADQIRADLELLCMGRSVKRRHAMRQILRRTNYSGLVIGAVALVVMILLSFQTRAPRTSAVALSTNAVANEAYNSGMVVLHSGSGNYAEAAKLFEQAIRYDTNFPAAYARLSLTYIQMGAGLSDTEFLRKARAAAEKAISLNENLPDAHSCLGSVTMLLDYDWKRAEKELSFAYKLSPDSEDVLYQFATTLLLVGQTKEAVRLMEKAQRVESRSATRLQNAGWILLVAHEYQRAIAKFDEVLVIQKDKPQRIWNLRVAAYCGIDDYTKAIQVEREAALLNGRDLRQVNEQFDALQQALKQNGPDGYWREKLHRAKQSGSAPMLLAALYARVGEAENAIAQLQQALKATPQQLYFKINTDAAFDSLRSDPRFVEITEKIGMPKRIRVP